jgi:hypothetical protein
MICMIVLRTLLHIMDGVRKNKEQRSSALASNGSKSRRYGTNHTSQKVRGSGGTPQAILDAAIRPNCRQVQSKPFHIQ